MGRTLNEDDVLKEIDRWIGYLDEDMITRIKISIRKIPSAQPDWNEMIVMCDCCGHAIHVKRIDAERREE